MSSEDAMDGRAGSAPPSSTDAAPASEVEGVAKEAPPPAARPVRVLVSPIAADGSPAAAGTVLPPAYTGVLYLQQQRHEWPPMGQQPQGEDGDDPKKMRAKWFDDMRGWLMVVAVQVASVTYQAGLNPPDEDDFKKVKDDNKDGKSKRYYMFFYFNSTAFVTSLAIIILLMNRSFYASEARVVALEIVVVLDMVGLMGAYWAGSTSKDQTTKYTLVLTAFVLFALYVVYMVQLLPKLGGLAAAVVPRRTLADAAGRVRHDAAADGALPMPASKIGEARWSQRPQGDVGRSVPTPRRRGSRLAGAVGTEPSRMLSP